MVPRVRASANLRVPDLGVTCAPVGPGQIELPDPILLVEVLYPGNEIATRENVWAYTTIPSVDEILLVHSTRVVAELLRRRSDLAWPEDAAEIGPEGTLHLRSIDLTCPLRDVYAGTYLG